jgi:hypothetical protein
MLPDIENVRRLPLSVFVFDAQNFGLDERQRKDRASVSRVTHRLTFVERQTDEKICQQFASSPEKGNNPLEVK